MTRPNQGLSSLAPGGGKMRDPGNEVAAPSEMLALISSVCIHSNVRHHTELFEKSNKIKEGNTHSKPATKSLENLYY